MKIRVNGSWKKTKRKIRISGSWRNTCWKYRHSGEWKSDQCTLDLYIPPRQAGDRATINLQQFIEANNPQGLDSIRVFNLHTQPQIITGNLSAYELVTFINRGEIQGNNVGAFGFQATSNLKFINEGWVRGAGGNGGHGGKSSDETIQVGHWNDTGTWDDGGPYSGNSPSWNSQQFYNRFWKRGVNSSVSGAWTTSSGANQQYFNVTQQPNFGDQGVAFYTNSHTWMRPKPGTNGIQNTGASDRVSHAGNYGSGGIGQYYGHNLTQGTDGLNGTVTGYSPGWRFSNGINLAPPDLTGRFKGGKGGAGGTWGDNGHTGYNSGDGHTGVPGTPAGKAIIGSSYLISGSVVGNLSGQVQ